MTTQIRYTLAAAGAANDASADSATNATDTADTAITADDAAESEAAVASANTHPINILDEFHYDLRRLDGYEGGIGGRYITYSCNEDGYSTLNEGLQQLSETIRQDATARIDELETLARSMAEEGKTDQLGSIAYNQTTRLVRADSSMVSILVITAINQGGSQPSHTLTAYNIDPSSGMQFELDELIQDNAYEGLAERLATALVAKYDPSSFNAYPDLQTSAGESAALKEEAIIAAIAEDIQTMIDEGSLTYTVGQSEITFYWEPGSLAICAAGTLQLPIPYADAPNLVWEGFTHAPSWTGSVGRLVMTNTWMKSGNELIEEIRTQQTPANAVSLWYIGQMGLVIKWQDTLLYIDPVLNDLTDDHGVTRRNYPQPFAADAIDTVDYVFCTHNHADHLNLATLLPLYRQNKTVRFVVPAPLAQVLTDAGIADSRVVCARADQPLSLSGMTVYPVAAAHEDYQTDRHGDQLCLGYILEMGGIRIYHAGDTLVTDRLVADLRAHAPYDAVFLPINGRDEERHQRGIIGNMNLTEAADLAHTIGTRLVVPMHYDMVMGNGEDPERFAAYMDEQYPSDPYRILRLGERLEIGNPG